MPKIGIVSCNSLQDWIYDDLGSCVNLSEEEALAEMRAEGMTEEEIENSDFYCDENSWLIGDWKKDEDGRYYPDESGEFSAILSSNGHGNNVAVSWSRHVSQCRETSFCYRHESGELCGNLNAKDEGGCETYDLPPDYYRGGDDE